MKKIFFAALLAVALLCGCSKEKVDISLTIDIENVSSHEFELLDGGLDFRLPAGGALHWSETVRGEEWNGACSFELPIRRGYRIRIDGEEIRADWFTQLWKVSSYSMERPSKYVYKLSYTLTDFELSGFISDGLLPSD